MIWLPVMFCDEPDMLDVRLDEALRWQLGHGMRQVRHVIAESPVTHRGVPKPLHFAESGARFEGGAHSIHHVIAALPDAADPWVREHAQRDAAWPVIDAWAENSDWVLISDVDEIPSSSLLSALAAGALPDPCAIRMRVFIYAVDWEVPQEHVPPQCVAATAGYIRRHGGSLAAVRDARASYPVVDKGGWHFSWLGGPDALRRKLHEKTCHTELLTLPVRDVIESGAAYESGADGGGLPVKPVTVDDTWPALIRDRRVPAEWYRPRDDWGDDEDSLRKVRLRPVDEAEDVW